MIMNNCKFVRGLLICPLAGPKGLGLRFVLVGSGLSWSSC